jgi:hypothetical protein
MNEDTRPEPGPTIQPAAGRDARQTPSGGPPRPVLVGAGVLGAIAVILVAVVLLQPGADPAGDAGPSPTLTIESTTEPTPVAATATPEPVPSPTPQPNDGWQEAAAFGAEGTIERAESATQFSGGYLAVGTWYGVADLPHSGPVPQEGRVWRSADGRSWEDVTPAGTFADAGLSHVYLASDGTLIALGTQHEASEDATPMAWESADGRTWSQTSIGLTGSWIVDRIVRGPLGYLALISVAPDIFSNGEQGLWLSADGRSWEMVRAAANAEQFFDIGAGDDGFAATGSRGEPSESFAVASADGRTWIEATMAPSGQVPIAERGGDWVAIAAPLAVETAPTVASLWSSANGLEWSESGSIPLHPVPPETDGPVECSDIVVDLHAAGPWLIANAAAGYALCSEGRIETYGSQSISRDGRAWEVLPFPAFSFEGAGRRGSEVNAAFVDGETVILVGHAASRATFWFNEAP